MARAEPDPFEILVALERELHQPAIRRNVKRLEELLHVDFLEIGRSGRTYGKASTIAALLTTTDASTMLSDGYGLRHLGSGVALLTYRSLRVLAGGSHADHTMRSSIWQHTRQGWQIAFHQGTPTLPFAVDAVIRSEAVNESLVPATGCIGVQA